MLLAIDVGNTHMVCGVFKNDQLIHNWRIQTKRKSTADELASVFHGLFSFANIQLKDIKNIVIASVVPALQMSLKAFSKEYLNIEAFVITSETVAEIKILTDFPKEVGADRVVNALAARKKYGTPAIIVDFGTAITFDCVNIDGDYLGGAIVPGMAIAIDALSARTAKLPRVDISTTPEKAIGKNTEDAIRSGILYGYGGLVEGIIAKTIPEIGGEPNIIATGGMAHLVAPFAPSIQHVDPLLTLMGLYEFYENCR